MYVSKPWIKSTFSHWWIWEIAPIRRRVRIKRRLEKVVTGWTEVDSFLFNYQHGERFQKRTRGHQRLLETGELFRQIAGDRFPGKIPNNCTDLVFLVKT